MQCNAFEMTHDGVRCGVAVYPDVAVFNHSCQANATLISVPDDGAEDNEDEEQVADNWPKELLGVKCMVALCDIAEGDEINICYVHPKVRFVEAFWRFVRLLAQLHTHTHVQAPTEERRSQLWKNWFFWCQCPSCSDPSNYEAYGLLLSPLAIAIVLCPSAAELVVCVCVGNSERYAMRHLCPRKGCGGYRYAVSRSCYYRLAVV